MDVISHIKEMNKVLIFMFISIVGIQGQTIDLIPYLCDAKWGFCTTSGTEIIEAEFDSVDFFLGNTAVVQLDSKYGLIDKTGKTILETKFDEIVRYNDKNLSVKVRRGKKWKIYDENGKRKRKRKRKLVITSHTIHDCVRVNPKIKYSDIYVYSKNGKYGLLKYNKNDSLNKKEVIYGDLIYDEYLDLGVENMVALKIDENWKLYDYSGKLLNINSYDKIDTNSIGRRNEFYFKVTKDGKIGLISKEGVEIIKPKYNKVEMLPEEIYIKMDYWSKIEIFKVYSEGEDWYYINKEGFEFNCQTKENTISNKR